MELWTANLFSSYAIDIETTGLGRECEIISAAIAWDDGDCIKSEGFWLDRYCNHSASDREKFQAFINRTLLNPEYPGEIVFHNIDFDLKYLLRRFSGIGRFSSNSICKVSDTLTISRVSKNNKYISHIDPKRLSCHSLKFLAKEFLNIEHKSFDETVNHGNIRFADRETVLRYNRDDAEITLRLYRLFRKTLDSAEWSYIEKVEIPHLLNLFHMNWSGVPYDATNARHWLQNITDQMTLLEKQIHIAAGSTFNIGSQRELIAHLFFNPRLTYRRDGFDEPMKPLYLTPTGQSKVDLDTLVEISRRLRECSNDAAICVDFINLVIQYTELSKTISFIETHLHHVQRIDGHERLFPNFSAEAKSGRIKSSKPNLLGLPKKIYKKTDSRLLSEEDRHKSVRNLLRVPDAYEVWSIDINALDLTVVTNEVRRFNPAFPWIELFERQTEHDIDIHMAVSARMDKKRYSDVLAPLKDQLQHEILDYIALKAKSDGVPFLHRKSSEIEFARFPNDDGIMASEIKKRRTLSKEINLSTTYMMGAGMLAQKLMKETGIPYTGAEARDHLNKFYETFPEIRKFQDEIGTKIYQHGFVQSVFGRKYFADVFDELNEHFHHSKSSGTPDKFEFICKINGKYWYVKAQSWLKQKSDLLKNLKLLESPFGFCFSKILCIEQLDNYTFRRRRKKRSSLFQKKSEQQQDEVSDYELNRIGLTNEIDRHLSYGSSVTEEANEILNSLVKDGVYFIPEKQILFYRVHLQNPSSKYFKFYKGFMKVVRKFFPMYCQGVAASVASMCLTQLRTEIESNGIDAQILLFVHDQIDVMVNKNDAAQMQKMLNSCVRSPKQPFSIPLSGKLEGPYQFIT